MGRVDATPSKKYMEIEKVNNFWVPSNDIHIDEWKAGIIISHRSL